MKSSRLLASLRLLATLVVLAVPFSVFGQAFPEWTNTGTNWSTGSNWTNGNGGAYGQLEFKGNGNVSSNNDFASLSQWRFYFSGSKAYTLTGNSVSLFDFGSAHSWLLSDSTANQAINLNVNFAAGTGNTFAQVSARNSGNLTLNTLGITGSVVSQTRFVGESTGTITVSGAISGTGKDVVIGVNQAGTDFGSTNVSFNGANSYSGQTFIAAGTLNLGSGSSMATSAFQLGQTGGTAGATLNLASTTGGQTFSNSLTVRSGSSGTKTISSANSSGTNTLSGAVTLNTDLTTLVNSSGGTLAFSGGVNVGANKLTVLGSGSTSISSALTSSLGAGGSLVKQGAGTLTLGSTSNTYTGTNSATLNANGTQINAGTLAIAGDTSLGLAPAGAYNNIQFTGSGTLRADATISLHANRDVSIASGQTATLNNNGNTFTINGIVNGTGGNVESSGAGTTIFTGSNTYSGTTTISAGTLQIGSGSSTGTLGGGAVTNNATLAFNRNNSLTVSNDISGTGSLAQSGSGTTILTGANSYGTTTISAGTLQIGSGGSTGTLGTGTVTNNAALVFNRASGAPNNFFLTNAISGSGTLTQSGGNIITIPSANSYTGATTINSGTLRVTANEALGTGAAGTTVNSGGTLLLSGATYSTAEALTINGTGVGGNGALRNNLGSSTYAGQVTAASNATINVTGAGESLTLTGGIVKNGTILTIKGNGSVIVNNTGISGASSNSDLVVDGGNLIVNAASNYNGPTTVQNSGTLVANAQIDTTTATVNSGSTLSGTSKVVAASGGSLFLNGQFIVGDSTLGSPVVSQFEAATSGAGSTVVGSTGVLNFDLFSGAGQGNNTGNAAAADLFKITGALSLVAGSTLEIANPNSLSGWLWGDKWKIWDTTSMGLLTGTITTINAPTLGGGLLWDLDETTGVLSIVPEPSKALFSLLGLFGLMMRRRRA